MLQADALATIKDARRGQKVRYCFRGSAVWPGIGKNLITLKGHDITPRFNRRFSILHEILPETEGRFY